MRSYQRSKRGASLALVAACAAGLMVLIFGCFQIAMLFSGARDVRNSIDACALNVSKRSVEMRVAPTPDFADCADSTGGIGLANVNRVWGKALLETANEIAMRSENVASQASTDNVNLAFENAQGINDSLYGTLADGRNLARFFSDLATNRTIGLPGSNSISASTNDTWHTARIDRGAESNLAFAPQQFPPGARVSPPNSSHNGHALFSGYTPFSVGDKQFYFVSFRANEMPHLISDSYFEQNRIDKDAVAGISNAIPNSFSVRGTTNGTSTLTATAYAAANPQKEYFLSIPHAFVSIRFSNVARWFVNGAKVNETTYGFTTETQWGAKLIPLRCEGKLNGYASLGNEYKGGSLWQALTVLPGDPSAALAKLVQRVQEIDPTFTEGQLRSLLQKQSLLPSVGTYLIYPIYKSADASFPDVNIDIAGAGNQKSAWLLAASRPDGLPKKVLTQEGERDVPNSDWQMIIGGHCSPGDHYTITKAQLDWQAGTGYTQHLGELRINHTTDCFFSAN